jgi:DNA-binding transcriptional LysR family regulator
LGVTLIDRSKRPFVLTPEGDVFYRGCRKLVQDYATLEEDVRTLHEEVEGLVRVASIYSVGLSHMNRCVQEFLQRHPRANVRIEYQHPETVYELVQRDQVDLGLVSYPRSSRSVKAIAWREETMVLVCAPSNCLAYEDKVELEQLDGERMVGFDEGLRIRSELDRALAAHGVEVKMVMEFDNIETIKRAIEIDAGVGILPEPTVLREVQAGSLVAVALGVAPDRLSRKISRGESAPLKAPTLARPLGIIVRRGKRLGATARRFVRALQERAGTPWDEDGAGQYGAKAVEPGAASHPTDTARW